MSRGMAASVIELIDSGKANEVMNPPLQAKLAGALMLAGAAFEYFNAVKILIADGRHSAWTAPLTAALMLTTIAAPFVRKMTRLHALLCWQITVYPLLAFGLTADTITFSGIGRALLGKTSKAPLEAVAPAKPIIEVQKSESNPVPLKGPVRQISKPNIQNPFARHFSNKAGRQLQIRPPLPMAAMQNGFGNREMRVISRKVG